MPKKKETVATRQRRVTRSAESKISKMGFFQRNAGIDAVEVGAAADARNRRIVERARQRGRKGKGIPR
jgi:hypothetical protein